jgi:cytochrome c oxidase assembly protein subunit 15
MGQKADNRRLCQFAVFTAVGTLCLICVGGVVTSKGVGMAVPDWPTTYGYNPFFFPLSKWVGGIRDEHTHRLVASGVGLLTTILALWLYGRKSRPWLRWGGLSLLAAGLLTWLLHPARLHDGLLLGIVGGVSFAASFRWPAGEPAATWLRRLGLIAFVTVVLQGILGGLRVTAMKDELGIVHATLAQLFFCLICALALFTSRWWRSSGSDKSDEVSLPEERPRPGKFTDSARTPAATKTTAQNCTAVRSAFLVATSLVFAQLVLGATMRHQHAGLAIPDFPTAYGKVWPDLDAASIDRYNHARVEVSALNSITAFQVSLQMIHRLVAVLIGLAVVGCAALAARRLGRRHPLSRFSRIWLGLIALQILLGAATIWTGKSADIATAHVAVGALALASGTLATILAVGRPPAARAGSIVAARQTTEPGSLMNSPTPAANLRS